MRSRAWKDRRNALARARWARDPEGSRRRLRERRRKAVDRGRCGKCVTRYCEPGYRTCPQCLEAVKRYKRG